MALAARPATPVDLDAVLDLRWAWEAAVHGEPRTTRAMLAAHWPEDGHWAVDGPGGRVDGYAEVDSGGGFTVWVRAGEPAGEIAGPLLSAIRSHTPGRIETVVPLWAGGMADVLERLGCERLRDVLEMRIELGPAAADPVWPDGIRLRPFVAERDAADVHACLVEAFAASDEHVAPYAEWRPWLLGDPSYDPALVFVAESDGAVTGMAQCWTEGFVKDLAVRPAFRGRGLGEALLQAAFAEFARRGVSEVRLKVDADNPTGAVRLYRRVGMEERRRHAVYVCG
ncbi:MAG TPA: GNAT family N-acetyltransferase, partial [Gaiellales bacterium]|nr:GNAT family N-acetyltransferase [Gaiellales bacterium]